MDQSRRHFPPGASQNWTDGNNWDGGVAPGVNDVAQLINAGGVALIDSDVEVGQLLIGLSGAGGDGVYVANGGSLTVNGVHANNPLFRLWNTSPGIRFTVAAGGSVTASGAGIQVGSTNAATYSPAIFDAAGSVSGIWVEVKRDSIYNMSGGSLTLSENGGAIRLGQSNPAIATATEGLFRHTGGSILANQGQILLRAGGTYEISGGSISMNNANGLYFREASATTSLGGTIRVIGSGASAINFGGLRYLAAEDASNATWAFVLDNSANHITKINFTGNGAANGDLRRGTLDVALHGGVLLSGDATFGLITAPTINDATDFDNGPGALWTAGLDDDTVDTVTITLAAVANKGAVDAAGTTSVSFAGANVGFVELLNVTGTSLSVYLDIDGGTLANFTSALTDVGINWSTTDLPAGYELVLTDLDPSTSGSAYFAWDLSKIDSSMTIQGVSIAIPEPTSAMLVGIGGLALCVRVRRRL